MAPVKVLKSEIARVSSRESVSRNCGSRLVYIAGCGATLLVKHGNLKNKNKLVELKEFVDAVGIKEADLKDEFSLAAFGVTLMKRKAGR